MLGKVKIFLVSTVSLLVLAVVAYFCSTKVLANGGGVYTNSAIIRSSDPIIRNISDVFLISEKLFIRPVSNRCEVTVKYTLHNTSENDYIDLDYAFPVDRIDTFDRYGGEPAQNIEFYLNGKQLSSTHSSDTLFIDHNLESKYDMDNLDYLLSGVRSSMYRRWYYTKITLPKNSFVNLEVRYSVGTLNRCDGDSPLLLDYDFYGCSGHFLFYDFSPASAWGDGIIRDFYVEIDGTDLDLIGESYRKIFQEKYSGREEMFNVGGLDFETIGNKRFYRARNFDLKKAKPLFLSYNTSKKSSLDIIAQRRIPNDRYTFIVSDEQEKYPAKYLTDMNLETAWVSGKNKGTQIEFIFNEPIEHVSGFSLLNGYHKNAETYSQNNRIKKIKVEVKHTGDDDWQVMDWLEEFEDKPYYTVYFSDIFYHAELIDFLDVINERKTIDRVRITIEDIYPGTKYDDTCISEVILYTWSSPNGLY